MDDTVATRLSALWVPFVVEGSVFGLYSGLFVLSTFLLIRRRPNFKMIAFVLVGNTVLYFLCLAHVISVSALTLKLNVLFSSPTLSPNGSRFAQLPPLVAASGTITITVNLVADTILIFRCWLTWGRRWLVIVLPSLLSFIFFLLQIVEAIKVEHGLQHLGTPISGEGAIGAVFGVSSVIAVCSNIILTLLIAGRIYWVSSRTTVAGAPHTGGSSLLQAIRILVESGALYVLMQILVIVVAFDPALKNVDSNAAGYNSSQSLFTWTVPWIAPHVYAIASTFIIIGIQWSKEDHQCQISRSADPASTFSVNLTTSIPPGTSSRHSMFEEAEFAISPTDRENMQRTKKMPVGLV